MEDSFNSINDNLLQHNDYKENHDLENLCNLKIRNTIGQICDAHIFHGRSLEYVSEITNSWKHYMYDTIDRIEFTNETELIEEISSLPFHDFHWEWGKKYNYYNSKEYDWFYFVINNKVEAISFCSSPKRSVIDSENIFYIEYIAVAPWNRNHKLIDRHFKGLGYILIKEISKYFHTCKNYRFGFSLSAVPQAINFYQQIGMIYFGQYNHDGLYFYEMNFENAKKLIEEDANDK